MTFMREPLFHFLAAGLAIFGVSEIMRDAPEINEESRIVVTAAEVEYLRGLWERQWQRSPTPKEVHGLIEDRIREEVLYREAMVLGLDRDDLIIRRRLVQKFQFLTEDLVAPREPDADKLQAYFGAHLERYMRPPRLSFTQITFSSDDRGRIARRDAESTLASLRSAPSGASIAHLGDGFMLETVYEGRTIEDVEALFGREFADRVLALDPGIWSGPIVSGYGLHLVRLDAYVAGRLPSLSEVEERVRSDWAYDQRQAANRSLYQRLLARYDVTVEGAPAAEVRDGDAATAPGPGS